MENVTSSVSHNLLQYQLVSWSKDENNKLLKDQLQHMNHIQVTIKGTEPLFAILNPSRKKFEREANIVPLYCGGRGG